MFVMVFGPYSLCYSTHGNELRKKFEHRVEKNVTVKFFFHKLYLERHHVITALQKLNIQKFRFRAFR